MIYGIVNAKASAINLKAVEEIFVILISDFADVFGLISFIIFLIRRFACDIAIIAAGTKPPMNIPRRDIPVNQEGIEYKINDGTTSIPRESSGKCERKFIARGTAYTRIPISAIIASAIA